MHFASKGDDLDLEIYCQGHPTVLLQWPTTIIMVEVRLKINGVRCERFYFYFNAINIPFE